MRQSNIDISNVPEEIKMSYAIVSDSSSNVLDMHDEHYRTVPLHIIIDGKDWPDTLESDMKAFNEALLKAEKTSTSCPSPDEWLQGFGDADEIYCFTISHNLSGSYNCAVSAKNIYEEQHPDRHVYVIDSLATGPKMILMIELLNRLLAENIRGEEAVKRLTEYRDKKTELLFTLQSINRLANNGRVNPILVKAIGMLDLRIIGEASREGTIAIAGKHRGAAKVMKGTYKQMLKMGYNGGRIIISHNGNPEDAEAIARLAREQFGENTQIDIHSTTELCSFYAEPKGYIVGFETDEQAKHHFIFD